jgi:Flp pilus assembly protein TadG
MTIVETVLVLGVFLLVFLGLFEYCRFLMVLHVANNAARDGARYATVNVNCPSDEIATTQAAIIAFTTYRMGGVDQQITGYQVAVYPVDSGGLALTPPVVRSKSLNPPTWPDPFNPADANNPPWNSANFTEKIAVQIKGTYRPVTPLSINTGRMSFGLVPDNIPINVIAMMGSEG